MIDLAPEYLESIRAILAGHLPNCEVRAFGSRVRGTATRYSDLDLVLVGEERIAKDCLNRLEEAFAESDLPIRVDILDWWAITESFRAVINRHYEVVQGVKQESSNMVHTGLHDT